MNLFVTGIDTNIGKTVISSILVKKLNYGYWKPIQSGDLDNSDSMTVKRLVPEAKIYPEQFKLNTPASPHLSAKLDGIEINTDDFQLPTTEPLIIEGAGGLLVPINEKGDYIADIIKPLNAEVVLVSKNYLGSINHTLLSIEYLKQKNIPIKGIIFTGKENDETQHIILQNSGVKFLGFVPFLENLDSDSLSKVAKGIEI